MFPEISTNEESQTEWAGKVVSYIDFLGGLPPWDDLAAALSDHLRDTQVETVRQAV